MKRRSWGFRFAPVLAAGAIMLAAASARSEDLDARKTGPQLFEQTCSSCHHGPGGLARGRNASGLVSFLREHYTTGPGPAGQLAAYLLANQGSARRPRPATNPAAPDAAEQATAHRQPQGEPAEAGRPGARRRHHGEPPEPSAERQAAPVAEPGTPGHRGRAQRAGRPGENAPGEAAARPAEATPANPVAAEAAAPVQPPAGSRETPGASPGAPQASDDQPAFSAPTP